MSLVLIGNRSGQIACESSLVFLFVRALRALTSGAPRPPLGRADALPQPPRATRFRALHGEPRWFATLTISVHRSARSIAPRAPYRASGDRCSLRSLIFHALSRVSQPSAFRGSAHSTWEQGAQLRFALCPRAPRAPSLQALPFGAREIGVRYAHSFIFR